MSTAKPLVIFGAGKVTEVVTRHLERENRRRIEAFTCESPYVPADPTYLGRPLVDFTTLAERFPPDAYDLLVAIGYHRLNGVRRRICSEAKALGYTLASYVSDRAGSGAWLAAGENCIVLDNATIEPGAVLGNDVVVWSGALVGHHTVVEDHCWIAGHAVLGGNARLGAGSFVGLGAVVGHEVDVGADSFLGAGVVVTKCTPPKSVFVGRDTERFRLDSDHFLRISKML